MPSVSAPTAIAQEFDIGGRSLYIECRGEGSPTILFLHGYDGDRTHGYHLFDGYADRHRVCVYDRAHMGLSDPAEGVQSGADIIGDLKRLLKAADVPGPHLLVANSFGGVLAEIFAGDQPDEVAGMVLVDASLHSDADLDRYFADRGESDLEELKAKFASGPEPIHWTIHDEAREALERIPDVPITYLRASQGSDVPPEAQEIWEAGLDALLARSSSARVVDVDGPHTLPPPPVHEAVDQMLALLREGRVPATPSNSATSPSTNPNATTAGSAQRFAARPAGDTSAPLGYYEYLPPGYGDGDPRPLLVFVHGKDECGDGSLGQLADLARDPGSIPALIQGNDWPDDRPFVVLAPQHGCPRQVEQYDQCGGGQHYGSCMLELQHRLGHPEDGSLCMTPTELYEFISYAVRAHDVDPQRVYLTGLSCGGYAAFEYAAEHGATQIAAMVPIAGEGRPAWEASRCELGQVAIWAFHGSADYEIDPRGTTEPMSNLMDCPQPPRQDVELTVYPGVDHNSWSRTYDLSAGHDIYEWLLRYSLP